MISDLKSAVNVKEVGVVQIRLVKQQTNVISKRTQEHERNVILHEKFALTAS